AIALVYLASAVLGLFGVNIGNWQSTGAVGIGISLVVVVVAALNLVLDFAMVQDGAAQGAPKYMEWYGAFGLLVTLVWLYLEILRLLAKLNQRR
ncbi:MAG: Bax inhibitor-1/YccA family protein, partial [Pseudomonadota bacterium]